MTPAMIIAYTIAYGPRLAGLRVSSDLDSHKRTLMKKYADLHMCRAIVISHHPSYASKAEQKAKAW